MKDISVVLGLICFRLLRQQQKWRWIKSDRVREYLTYFLFSRTMLKVPLFSLRNVDFSGFSGTLWENGLVFL